MVPFSVELWRTLGTQSSPRIDFSCTVSLSVLCGRHARHRVCITVQSVVPRSTRTEEFVAHPRAQRVPVVRRKIHQVLTNCEEFAAESRHIMFRNWVIAQPHELRSVSIHARGSLCRRPRDVLVALLVVLISTLASARRSRRAGSQREGRFAPPHTAGEASGHIAASACTTASRPTSNECARRSQTCLRSSTVSTILIAACRSNV